MAINRLGQPLTDAERAVQHYAKYGTTELPPRGTGLAQRQALAIDWGQVLGGMLLGGFLVLFLAYGVGPAIAEVTAAKIRKRK